MDLLNKISDAFTQAGILNIGKPEIDRSISILDMSGGELFYCTAYSDQPTSHIDRFKVGENYLGKKMSKIPLRAIVQHFNASGSQYIDINLVRNDGLSFWPRFGAMPSGGAPSFRKYLSPFIEDEFMKSDGKILQEASRIAEKNPEDAWFYITDPKTKASRAVIERLNSSSKDSTMCMDLQYSVVRERLDLNNF